MAACPELRHVAMFPFMAKGHATPLPHLPRLLLGRRRDVTFFTTPRNAPFISAGLAGAAAAVVVELPLPSDDGPQSTDELPSVSLFVDVLSAVFALRAAFTAALIHEYDGFLVWAKYVADDLDVPRLVSLGIGSFASYVSAAVKLHKPHGHVSSPSEPFPVHGLPGFHLTKGDLHPPFDEPEPTGPHWDMLDLL